MFQGGLTVLDVIDYYGVTFPTLTLIIFEMITFCWIYGVNRLCADIKFMLGIETGLFWRICWGFLTLLIIVAIFLLEVSRYELMGVPIGINGKMFDEKNHCPLIRASTCFSFRMVSLFVYSSSNSRMGLLCSF